MAASKGCNLRHLSRFRNVGLDLFDGVIVGNSFPHLDLAQPADPALRWFGRHWVADGFQATGPGPERSDQYLPFATMLFRRHSGGPRDDGRDTGAQ